MLHITITMGILTIILKKNTVFIYAQAIFSYPTQIVSENKIQHILCLIRFKDSEQIKIFNNPI